MRRARNFFRLDNLVQIVMLVIGLLVAMSLGFPQAFPQLKRGASCINLPHPPGGNQRSLLAYTDDFQNLELNLVLGGAVFEEGRFVVDANSAFEAEVVFRNSDSSPIYLYYEEAATSVLTTPAIPPTTAGLYVIVVPATTTINFGDPPLGDAAPTRTFDQVNLYVLQARNRCNIRVPIEGGLIPGQEYRMVAVYQNTDPGLPTGPAFGATATPLPLITDTQGVWSDGRAISPEIRFVVR